MMCYAQGRRWLAILRSCRVSVDRGGMALIDDSADFDLGDVRVQPSARTIVGARSHVTIEPLVMQLLLCVARQAGQLVERRRLFARLWGATAVGDDSLNRLVAVLRKALRDVGSTSVVIETVPAAGHVLRLKSKTAEPLLPEAQREATERVIAAARDSWRLAWPEPDHLRIEMLRHACAADSKSPIVHGWRAMLCRHAAEYCEPGAVPFYLAECEASAQRALNLEPGQAMARVALTSVAPLYGRWLAARATLTAILDDCPGETVAAHDLSILEISTGRVRAGKAIRDALIAADPFAAAHAYKSVYQNWSIGDHAAMDLAADRAMQLWPLHPAVWMVRLWTLAYTQRAVAARDMVEDALRPTMPDATIAFLRQVLQAVTSGSVVARETVVTTCRAVARNGPAHAIASMTALGLIERYDDLFDVAAAYYFRDGAQPVPLRHAAIEPALNEQHRRLTQVLFMPVFEPVRGEARFRTMCARIGLTRYWDESGMRPDFECDHSAA